MAGIENVPLLSGNAIKKGPHRGLYAPWLFTSFNVKCTTCPWGETTFAYFDAILLSLSLTIANWEKPGDGIN